MACAINRCSWCCHLRVSVVGSDRSARHRQSLHWTMTLPPRRRVTAKPDPKTPETAVGEDTTSLLLKMLEQVRQDMQAMQTSMQARDEASSQGRARLYDRIDEVANDVGTIKGDIRILGEVDSQVRGELQALKTTVEANQADTKPTIDAWRDMRNTGRRLGIAMGIAGLSFAGILTGIFTWFGDTLPSIVKSWLRLG